MNDQRVQNNAKHLIEKKLNIGQAINYVLYLLLIGLFIYWNLQREHGFKLSIFVFQTLPLLAFLPGMFKQAYRTYSWLCFILLFYFIFAIQSVFSSISTASDYIFLVLVVLLFINAMFTSRWMQRVQKGVY